MSNEQPIGYLDSIAAEHIQGWASPGATIEIKIADIWSVRMTANDLRPDLALAGRAGCGFSVPIPRDCLCRSDMAVNALANDQPLCGSGKCVGELLRDASLIFDQCGNRIIGADIPAATLNNFFGRHEQGFDLDALTPLVAALTSAQFVNTHLNTAKRFADPMAHLAWAICEAPAEGLCLEFGVWSGRSINEIARHRSTSRIFGFDSFKGLPEDWRSDVPKGAFPAPVLPIVAGNVELIIGWFNETLPGFCRDHAGEAVALAHIDCDLYSSTKTVLDNITPMLRAVPESC